MCRWKKCSNSLITHEFICTCVSECMCVLYIIFPRVSVCLCGDNKLQIYFYFIIILFYYLYNFNSLLRCRVYCTHLQNCFYFNSHSFSAKKKHFFLRTNMNSYNRVSTAWLCEVSERKWILISVRSNTLCSNKLNFCISAKEEQLFYSSCLFRFSQNQIHKKYFFLNFYINLAIMLMKFCPGLLIRIQGTLRNWI